MFNSQYYTCEQVDERLLQGYVDDFNEVNSTNYSKEDLLLKLFQAINWDQVFGKYEENPEFVRLYIDVNQRILWGIRANGDIYYGVGVPSQIKNYISSKISELHLDRVGDILLFLDDLIEGDKTLQELLNEKVDKEEGKSLIDAEYASGVQYIENPEFVSVKLDSNGKILEATRKDGNKILGAGLIVGDDTNIEGNLKIKNHLSVGRNISCGKKVDIDNGFIQESIDSDEYIYLKLDKDGRIIEAIIKNGGDCIYGGINLSDFKRDYDVDTLKVGYDVDTDDIYTIENTDSAISLEYDENTGDIYEVKDSRIKAEIVIDNITGDVFIEQEF